MHQIFLLKKNIVLFLASFLIFTSSCGDKKNRSINHSNLNREGIFNLQNVFTKKESKVKKEKRVRAHLSTYYNQIWEKGDLWGGVLVAKGHTILLEKYRGYAQANHTEPINENTPMHVASVSKTLTSLAVLKLVDENKLHLDDKVTKFFPLFPHPKITVQLLLSQRSGLPRYEYFIEKLTPAPSVLSKKFLTNQDILNLLQEYKPALARETDTGFMYCNTNFAMLALIVEKVTGQSFPQAMEKMIFKPLQMNHSYIFQEKDTLRATKSFYQRGPKVIPYDRLDLIYGDKNVYTTPRDLFNFSKALFSKNFIKDELRNQIFEPYSHEKPGVNNYGLGFRMKIFDNGEKLTYHNGWWHGSNSVFVHLLKSKATIIAIGNKYSNSVYSAVALSALFEDFPYEKERLSEELKELGGL